MLAAEGLRFNPGLPALGVVHLAGAAVGILLMRRERALGWMLIGMVVALWVASGPVVQLGFTTLANRPWLALVAASDVLRRWWWPGRAVAAFHVLLAPLLAWAFGRLPRKVAWGLGLLTCVGLAVPLRADGLLPLATWDATPDRALTCLRDAPPGAVIDVPLLVDQKNLWYQTIHHHPLLGGMLLKKAAFAPAELGTLRKEDPLVMALEAVGQKAYTRRVEPATDDDRQRLTDLGYRYVLARIDAFRRPKGTGDTVEWVSEWNRPRRQMLAVLGEPAFEDQELAIWTIDRAALDCR